MRKSLIDQVKHAKHAYILQLSRSRSGMERRYSVYVDDDTEASGALDVLWPADSHGYGGCQNPKKVTVEPMLDGMIYSRNKNFPAFHFRFGGGGFSATDEIRSTLQRINPKIEVFTINGHSPSRGMI